MKAKRVSRIIEERRLLLLALVDINRTIYAEGAPLGSDRYFAIRGAVTDALKQCGELELLTTGRPNVDATHGG